MKNREATLRKHVFPTLGRRPIGEIKRTDIVRLLDKVEDRFGPSAADNALRVIRRVMSWHASRSDDFRSPIVRGMARTKPWERARQRILTDDELGAIWTAADASKSLFGPFVQFLLLTATRRTEAAQMARAEVVRDVWTIPQERYKTGFELVVPLSPLALSVLARLPKISKGELVFTTDGERPFAAIQRRRRSLTRRAA